MTKKFITLGDAYVYYVYVIVFACVLFITSLKNNQKIFAEGQFL